MTDRIQAALAALELANTEIDNMTNKNIQDILKAQSVVEDAAPDLAAEVIRLRKWQSEAVEWLRWFCENVEESWSIPPAPDLTRLIAEAEGE